MNSVHNAYNICYIDYTASQITDAALVNVKSDLNNDINRYISEIRIQHQQKIESAFARPRNPMNSYPLRPLIRFPFP